MRWWDGDGVGGAGLDYLAKNSSWVTSVKLAKRHIDKLHFQFTNKSMQTKQISIVIFFFQRVYVI